MSAINKFAEHHKLEDELAELNSRTMQLEAQLKLSSDEEELFRFIDNLILINDDPLIWLTSSCELGRIINPADGKEVIVRRRGGPWPGDLFWLIVVDLEFNGQVLINERQWHYATENFMVSGWRIAPEVFPQDQNAYVKQLPTNTFFGDRPNQCIPARYTTSQFNDMIANNNYYIGI